MPHSVPNVGITRSKAHGRATYFDDAEECHGEGSAVTSGVLIYRVDEGTERLCPAHAGLEPGRVRLFTARAVGTHA